MTESLHASHALYAGFTGQARRAVHLAHQEAVHFRNDHVGTVHLLLGVLREGSGGAARLLAAHEIDPEKVCQGVELQISPDGAPPEGEQLPLTPAVKRILDHAREEAALLHHSCVGTEHLLLGVLRESESLAVEILGPLGLTLPALRETARGLPEPENRDWLLRGAPAPGTRASGDPSTHDLDSVVTSDPLPQRRGARPVRQPSVPPPANPPSVEEQLANARFQLRAMQFYSAIVFGTGVGLLAGGPAGAVVGMIGGFFLAQVRSWYFGALIGCGAGLLSVQVGDFGHDQPGVAILAGVLGLLLGACMGEWQWLHLPRAKTPDQVPGSSPTSPTGSKPSRESESP
jgi:hypothetical protein